MTNREDQSPAQSVAELERIDEACQAFEDRWLEHERPDISAILNDSDVNDRTALIHELLRIDVEYRRRHGEDPEPADYEKHLPDFHEVVERVFARAPNNHNRSMRTVSWHIDSTDAIRSQIDDRIGETIVERYEIRSCLGAGAYGTVYLGYDIRLKRNVAIKFLMVEKFASQSEADQGRTPLDELEREAQTIAKLTHPAVVSVYDVGHDTQGNLYVVMQYVAGATLKDRLRVGDMPLEDLVRGLVAVADGVHHAHVQGVFHRDLKPANILVDVKGNFYVADFGLAIHESAKMAQRGIVAGTPLYMSPEQVRGETHRINHTTDIWAIGVILYEAACKKRPFESGNTTELFEKIRHDDPIAPRQIHGEVPLGLERICLKCLAKRSDERYSSAKDLAEELRAWLDGQDSPDTSSKKCNIVPRGLRAFSSSDRDFFLDLLPGPRNRNFLPLPVEFWKDRIDGVQSDAIPVGVMYGPSGCGKTSFVNAGLLPVIGDHVVAVYVEATAENTESRLLSALRTSCPALSREKGLVESCATLRRGTGFPFGQKAVIFIDQFEQWLHANQARQSNTLADALRQCDGATLQCVLMVRDDFWLATTRFMRQLEIPLVDKHNVGLIDLFDYQHAEKVLAEFGHAYERLPNPASLDAPQRKFVSHAIKEIGEDGYVVPVRLSLFVEMVKNKEWHPQTLKTFGGSKGLGVAFLEDCFDATESRGLYLEYADAARKVLKALLPEPGVAIKGRMRSYDDLRDATEGAIDQSKFDGLLRILDSEVRLISPSGVVGADPHDEKDQNSGPRYYQLTHDYLVAPIRGWLERKDRETWRGRAHLVLSERAEQWHWNREKRFLPSPLEYTVIVAGVRRWRRNRRERQLMTAAHRHYGVKGAVVMAVTMLLLIVGWWINGEFQGRRVAEALLVATPDDLPKIISGDFKSHRPWIEPRLREVLTDAKATAAEKLRASLALATTDPEQAPYLRERIYDVSLDELPLLRAALEGKIDRIESDLWTELHAAELNEHHGLRAGLILASLRAESKQWSDDDGRFLVRMLMATHPDDQRAVRHWLNPIRRRLQEPLIEVFSDHAMGEVERVAAAVTLAEYEHENAELLARLLAKGSPAQYRVLLPVAIAADRKQLVSVLSDLILKTPGEALSADEMIRLARQSANSAACLMAIDEFTPVLKAFSETENTEFVTQFSSRATDLNVKVTCILRLIKEAASADARFALLLALSYYDLERVTTEVRRQSEGLLKDLHANDSDSGIHSLTGHALKRLVASDAASDVKRAGEGKAAWRVYDVAAVPMTLVVVHHGEYLMGAPKSEHGRNRDEIQHSVLIERDFEISCREITRGQFEEYLRKTRARRWPSVSDYAPSTDDAMVGIKWEEAVLFCRWITEQAGMGEEDQCYSRSGLWQRNSEGIPLEVGFQIDRSGFRLPTETEWEYACRAGSKSAFCFGNDSSRLPDYCWFLGNAGGIARRPAQRLPNRLGLFDVHGNVAEWCQDLYRSYDLGDVPPSAISVQTTNRVLRGGSWHQYPEECRSAYRMSDPPDILRTGYGFRIARTLKSNVSP